MQERHTQIIEALSTAQKMEVNRLSDQMGVSKVTIRRDLDRLEKMGLIRREHGVAYLGSFDDLRTRMAFHYPNKKRIAELAAACVEPGETVLIESGSCCALLAETIAREGRENTVITNSAFIAAHLRSVPRAHVILLGGEYQPESQVLVGPMVRQCVKSFFVDKLFIGTDGFTRQGGFTGSNLMRAEAVRAMAEQANRTIILTESEKFSQQGVVTLLGIREVYAVYTDDRLSMETESFLLSNEVMVNRLPSSGT